MGLKYYPKCVENQFLNLGWYDSAHTRNLYSSMILQQIFYKTLNNDSSANSTFNLFDVLCQAKENLVITYKNTSTENKYIKIYEVLTVVPFFDYTIVRYVFSDSKNDSIKAWTKRNLLKIYALDFFISELKFFSEASMTKL